MILLAVVGFESLALGQECPSLTFPRDGATGVPVNPTITWDLVNGVEGYLISLGTTPNGTDILNSRSAGHINYFTPVTGLPDDTLIYATISLFLTDGGGLKHCPSEVFTTELITDPPECTTLTMPTHFAELVQPGSDISWNYAPKATGYYVSLGTSPGGIEIVENIDVRNVLSYNPPDELPIESEIFVTIVPYNENGIATGCREESFRTGTSNIDCSEFSPLIDLPDTIGICEGDFPQTVLGNLSSSGVRWFKINNDDTEELLSENPEFSIEAVGLYRYEAYNSVSVYGDTGECSTTKEFTVELSEPPEIQKINLSRVSNGLDMEISVSGNGQYEYALDNKNGTYQDQSIFMNIEPKDHMVYVREKNGCGATEQEVKFDLSLDDFPKFFTPNGDGVNDFWQFNPPSESSALNLEVIHIFDRYGKLIAQIDTRSKGWDGTFDGGPLPSSDYWFSAISLNRQIIKGHFSLKR